jgi:hypothetical protein
MWLQSDVSSGTRVVGEDAQGVLAFIGVFYDKVDYVSVVVHEAVWAVCYWAGGVSA